MPDTDTYHLTLPETGGRVPVVFSSPHSGRNYAEAFVHRSRLDDLAIRSSEDAFVEELFSAAPIHGAPLIAAKAPRAFVDLNRAADELDPAVIEGVQRAPHNPRIASGLGVIPRVVSQAQPIYTGKLTMAEAQNRIAAYWAPYHAQLRSLMDATRADFGTALLIDCHSMPHEAITGRARHNIPLADVVLGDRFGAACGQAQMEQVEEAFRTAGLRVSRNAPFAGGYITQAYGRPAKNQHAIQIEIDRALYMDEARIEKRADFQEFAALIQRIVADLCRIDGTALPLAAE
ncbi:N-formylglutamate amidohydrolase [Falsirhodobacter sp. alg1]|uniref:N-formylglutamate amidohydrolase n=1 Tax=Falsirhodobacter sp. alg1 TaxID=1472418 RepID=UPI0005EFCEEF|nr:N-formylglutamate amidohydrolase [Falsirhodobacter sp. alg1]